jgi:hypothetical protein
MRTRILRALAAAALAAGIGMTAVVATQASADSTPSAAAEVLSTTERGLCVRVGTGAPQSLWLVAATHKCPSGYWGPATVEQAFGKAALAGIGGTGGVGPAGPQGPKGDKGDPGDSRLVFAAGSKVVTANGDTSLTVSGLPAFSATQAKRTLADVNAEALPSGVTVKVGAPTAAAGGTTWTYPIAVTGLAKDATATVRVDVIAAPVS